MLLYLIMSNYNLIQLLNDISNNHLFYRWRYPKYKNYINCIINKSEQFGPTYVYDYYKKSKLPFVVFRTDDIYYYIDKNSNNLLINKYNNKLVKIKEFDLGNKNTLPFVLKYILNKV